MTDFLDRHHREKQRQADALLDAFRQEPVPPKGRPLPPHNNTATSIAAADAIAGDMGRLELLVLRCVIGLGNATTEELEEALSLPGNTVRPRIWTLRQKGFVRELEGTRSTKSGRQAQVHVATPEGLEAALEANEGNRRKAA